MPITIGALRESAPGETRVSLVPEVVDKFVAAGARVVLEPGAGIRAQFPDALYKKGEWLASSAAVLSQADVLLTVAPLSLEQISQLKPGAVVVGFLQAHAKHAEVKALRDRKITSFAVELDSAHFARPVDGRSVFAGLAGRLQGRADRRQQPRKVHAHADHGSRDDPPLAGADHRRGRRGASGHRHRPPPGCRGRSV